MSSLYSITLTVAKAKIKMRTESKKSKKQNIQAVLHDRHRIRF